MASAKVYLPHTRGALAPKDERHAVFAQWLIDTYGAAFLARGCGVLDVAGGKGHIGVALAAHGIPSVLLDPQAPLPTESSANYSIREEGNESTDSSAEAKNAGLVGYQRVIQESLMDDGSTLLNGTESLEATGEVTPVGEILRRCSIVVGMHPDQATEPAVDLAIQLGVPFAVVPCCVYPALFPHRRQRRSGHPVRGYESFCQYLVDKALFAELSSPQTTSLSFEGKNVVVYSLPQGAEKKGMDPATDLASRDTHLDEEDHMAAVAVAEVAACEAYVEDCRAELECCAATGKWFQALTILGAMARHPPPKVTKRRTEMKRREENGNSCRSSSSSSSSTEEVSSFVETAPPPHPEDVMTVAPLSLRPDAACGLFAARACAVAGEWRAAFKVLNILKRCKIAADAPILEAVLEACEKSGQWARAEALRKDYPGSTLVEDSSSLKLITTTTPLSEDSNGRENVL